MPETAQQPTRATVTTGETPVVHMTRRERIAAERAAAARGSAGGVAAAVAAQFGSGAASDGPSTPSGAVGPVAPSTPLAPSSPVLPERAAGVVTPPAPASPVVAETGTDAQGAFDDLMGIGSNALATTTAQTTTAPATTTVPVVMPTATNPARQAQTRRRADRQPGPRRSAGTVASTPARPLPTATRTTSKDRTPATGRAAGRGRSFRRTASRATAVGAVLFSAGLLVSTSLPAQALWTAQDAKTVDVTAASAGRTQSMSVGDVASAAVQNRDGYTVTDKTQYANTDSSTFTNDPDGTIQWPFLTGVPITSGFGGRNVEGCSFCSTNHMGVDFAPGEGTPIRVIAAGTVIKVQADDGGFGNDVWVQHDVDGKQFVSVYGHMEDNSFQVVQGQKIKVGDVLGKVGSTGNSTGPHLHLEIHVNDVPVDPLAWLKANAN